MDEDPGWRLLAVGRAGARGADAAGELARILAGPPARLLKLAGTGDRARAPRRRRSPVVKAPSSLGYPRSGQSETGAGAAPGWAVRVSCFSPGHRERLGGAGQAARASRRSACDAHEARPGRGAAGGAGTLAQFQLGRASSRGSPIVPVCPPAGGGGAGKPTVPKLVSASVEQVLEPMQIEGASTIHSAEEVSGRSSCASFRARFRCSDRSCAARPCCR